MAIYTVYNRNESVYGQLNTNLCSYYNIPAAGNYTFNTKDYPYIKISNDTNSNTKYYLNDGKAWTMSSTNCAAVGVIYNAYRDSWDKENQAYGDNLCPLQGLQFLEAVESPNEFYAQPIGSEKDAAIVTLANYRFLNKHLRSIGFQATHVDNNASFVESGLEAPYYKPYQHTDSQSMLSVSEGQTSNRYFWDFTPEQQHIILTENFSKEYSNDSYKIEVSSAGVVSFSTTIGSSTSVQKWDIKYTPYITIGIKRPYQLLNEIPIPLQDKTSMNNFKILEEEDLNAITIVNTGGRNSTGGLGMKIATDEVIHKPGEFEFKLHTELLFFPIKLYRNMKIEWSSNSLKINNVDFNYYIHGSLYGGSHSCDYLQKFFYDKDVELPVFNFQIPVGFDNPYLSGDYNPKIFIASQWTDNAGLSNYGSFAGFKIKPVVSDTLIKKEYIEKGYYLDSKLTFNPEKFNSEGFELGENVYIQGRKITTLTSGVDGYEYQGTLVNFFEWRYNTTNPYNGLLPRYISLQRDTSTPIIDSAGGSSGARLNQLITGVAYGKDDNGTLKFDTIDRPALTAIFYDKRSDKKAFGATVSVADIGLTAPESFGVVICASNKEDGLELDSITGTRIINLSKGKYILYNLYPYKITAQVVCTYTNGTTASKDSGELFPLQGIEMDFGNQEVRNFATTITAIIKEDNVTGSGGGGGSTEDPVTPNPNPSVTPIQ